MSILLKQIFTAVPNGSENPYSKVSIEVLADVKRVNVNRDHVL
jgi:hypothetical protein